MNSYTNICIKALILIRTNDTEILSFLVKYDTIKYIIRYYLLQNYGAKNYDCSRNVEDNNINSIKVVCEFALPSSNYVFFQDNIFVKGMKRQ